LGFEVQSLAEDGVAIVGQETVLGEERGGVGGIAEGDGQGGSGLNFPEALYDAVSLGIECDFDIGF